jgi:hypothetical protein
MGVRAKIKSSRFDDRSSSRLARGQALIGGQSYSHFLSEVAGPDGHVRWRSRLRLGRRAVEGYRHNLTTDTATGYTNRRDWQSKAMGGGVSAGGAVASMTGAATSTTATSLTNTGAAFPTAGQGLAGMIVAVGPNSSGAGSTVFGVILSNSGTVLTVDQWYSAGTLAAGTTPNGTGTYQVLPGQMPACFLALSSDAGAPSSADTTLTSELTTNGFARALGTFAHTAAAATYTLQKTTVNKEAVFSSLVLNSGAMPFESAEPSPPTLVSGDTLTQTVTVTVN